MRDAPDLVGSDMIRTLVGFDTTSRDSNLALIDWVRDYLEGYGVDSTLTFDDDRRKANLFATLPAQDGNATDGGIVLSGHTDVVPVDGQPWDTDPFDGDARSATGCYGRGVTDMKSFSAIGLAFVPEFLRRGLDAAAAFRAVVRRGSRLHRRAPADRRHRRDAASQPAGCIVGEPTGMQLVVAHKGKKSWRCRVRGHEAHSSLTPQGVNAVQIACEIVAYIARAWRARSASRRQDRRRVRRARTRRRTSASIRGGTALNIVPRDCTFDFEIRHLPFDDPDAFFADVEALRRSASCRRCTRSIRHTYIEFDHLSTLPGLRHARRQRDRRRSAARATRRTTYGKVSFGTEAVAVPQRVDARRSSAARATSRRRTSRTSG